VISDVELGVLAVLVLGLTAWGAWLLTRPPRCPRCQSATQPQPAELSAEYPPVFRVGFLCPICERIVAHHTMGTWE